MYYPILANATTPSQSPAIFFFHPGGFSDCSYKDLPGIVHMCEEFALRGFVVFNVEYRRGIIKDVYPYTTVQQVIENYRACQDGRGAIRSAFKRQDDGYNSDKYRIKKSQIFLAGMSAGGLIAMNIAYYTTTTQIAKIFPTTGAYTAEEILGPIDADFYYGDPATPFQTNIKGVLDMWGGLPLPKSYFGMPDQSGFFSGNTYNPPLIAFAGINDAVFPVPINSSGQKVFFSHDKSSEKRCLPNDPPYTPYKVNQLASSQDATMGSTLNMYTILKNLGVSTEMYLDCQAVHGLDKACTNALGATTNCYRSNYGTALSDPLDVETYFVQRACIFFQDNMNGVVNSGTTLFYECENTRGSCNDSYTGCSNADPCP